MSAARTIASTLDAAARRLGARGVATPRLDARLLVAHALGLRPEALLARPQGRVEAGAAAAVEGLVGRRAVGEPVARLVGRREFWSLPFALGPDVLDPRPDSETVVEAALAGIADRRAELRILDLGTGTGCLLLALLSELPSASGLGIDRCARACRVAADNAAALGLAGRAAFQAGDWGAGIEGRFNLIVTNPPYIESGRIDSLAPEVALHDPRLALDGGPDGLDAYRALVGGLPGLLAPRGRAAIEIGAGQRGAVAAILRARGLIIVERRKDLSGTIRCIVATVAGSM